MKKLFKKNCKFCDREFRTLFSNRVVCFDITCNDKLKKEKLK